MVPLLARTIFLALLGAALLSPASTLAQAVGSTDPLTISVSPQYPVPYGQVVLSPISNALDLSTVTFVVVAGGKEVYRGNAKPVAITLGGAGILTSVRATISSAQGSYSQSLSIRPQDVALVVEPIASAPVLYPGKPLTPLEGTARVVAVANLRTSGGAQIAPNTLSYSWTVDGAQVGSASGIGKNSISVESPLQYRAGDVSVVVASPDGALVGGAATSLKAQDPVVRVYENNPLLGIRFDHALSGSYTLTGTEISLYGAAYSFPTRAGAPTLQWFVGGASQQSGPAITLRPTGQGVGSANISLTAAAGQYVRAATGLSLSFTIRESTNFLGL